MKEKIAELKRLVATATNPRQRDMYQKLLEKAQKQRQIEKASTILLEAPESSVTTSPKKLQQEEEKSEKPSRGETKSKTKEIKDTNPPSPESKKQEPQTEKEPTQISQSPSATSETPPVMFQAIGVIEGIVSMEEKGKLSIAIEGEKYALRYVAPKKKQYQELVRELAAEKSLKRKMVVYPNYSHQEKKGYLSFDLVSVKKKEKGRAIFRELKPGEFKVAGFWQYIPYCEIPCITILRNYSEQLAKVVEQIGQKKARGLLKANHLPTLWSNAPIEAFKYDGELSKKEQMLRYFVQLKAKWKGESGLFEVIEEVGEASTDAPRYLRHKD